MPFAAALIMKEERLRTMAQTVSNRTGHVGLDNFDDALNADGALVTAAANQILLENQINILDPLPQIGEMTKSGIAVKTFVSQSRFGQAVGNNTVVRAIVEKIPHQLMNWDDPAQQQVVLRHNTIQEQQQSLRIMATLHFWGDMKGGIRELRQTYREAEKSS